MANEADDSLDTDKLRYVLRLYVTGSTPRSLRAIENMRRICNEHLRGRYELEVVDIYRHPEASRDQQIVAVPTLVKMLPLPLRRIIGDLSNEAAVLASLDLQSWNEGNHPPRDDSQLQSNRKQG